VHTHRERQRRGNGSEKKYWRSVRGRERREKKETKCRAAAYLFNSGNGSSVSKKAIPFTGAGKIKEGEKRWM
jgi:hypothetical protein